MSTDIIWPRQGYTVSRLAGLPATSTLMDTPANDVQEVSLQGLIHEVSAEPGSNEEYIASVLKRVRAERNTLFAERNVLRHEVAKKDVAFVHYRNRLERCAGPTAFSHMCIR